MENSEARKRHEEETVTLTLTEALDTIETILKDAANMVRAVITSLESKKQD